MRKAGTEQVVLLEELYRNSLNLVECASSGRAWVRTPPGSSHFV